MPKPLQPRRSAQPLGNSMKAVAIVVAVLTIGVLVLWLRTRNAPKDTQLVPESLHVAVCNSDGVTVSEPTGLSQTVLWTSLSKIGIRTTDDGPLNPDVFWELFDGGSTPATTFPGGATGEQECLTEFQSRLNGFRDDELIRAMGSTQNAYFVVWERQQASSDQ